MPSQDFFFLKAFLCADEAVYRVGYEMSLLWRVPLFGSVKTILRSRGEYCMNLHVVEVACIKRRLESSCLIVGEMASSEKISQFSLPPPFQSTSCWWEVTTNLGIDFCEGR